MFQWSDLLPIAERGGALWHNDSRSKKGVNDRISTDQAISENSSLKLIHVDKLDLYEHNYYGKKQIRGHFSFDGFDYDLAVTDPYMKTKYTANSDSHQLKDCFLTISLAENEIHGFYYKLIAAVLERP